MCVFFSSIESREFREAFSHSLPWQNSFFFFGYLFATALKPKSQDRATTLKLSTVSTEWLTLQKKRNTTKILCIKTTHTKVYEKLHYFFNSDRLCIAMIHYSTVAALVQQTKNAQKKISCLSTYMSIFIWFFRFVICGCSICVLKLRERGREREPSATANCNFALFPLSVHRTHTVHI